MRSVNLCLPMAREVQADGLVLGGSMIAITVATIAGADFATYKLWPGLRA